MAGEPGQDAFHAPAAWNDGEAVLAFGLAHDVHHGGHDGAGPADELAGDLVVGVEETGDLTGAGEPPGGTASPLREEVPKADPCFDLSPADSAELPWSGSLPCRLRAECSAWLRVRADIRL